MLSRLISCPSIILLLTLPGTLQARDGDYFERLFTSLEQRDRIDAVRYAREPEPVEIVTIKPVKPKPDQQEVPANISLRGMVRSANGEPIYWINDSNSMQADFLQDNITVLPGKDGDRQVKIRLPDDRVIPLYIGESYIPGANETRHSDTSRVEMRN